MQVKLKICAGCDQPRKIWKQFEGKRYCQNCWNKIKPTKAVSSTAPSSFQRIPKESDKRKKEHVLYTTMRLQFLKLHPMCQAAIQGVCKGKADQIHHSHSGKDREKYYLDTTTWYAVDHSCHEWIHNNPIESKELGYLK